MLKSDRDSVRVELLLLLVSLVYWLLTYVVHTKSYNDPSPSIEVYSN